MRYLAIVLVLGACSITVDGVPSSYRPRRGGPPPTCTRSFAAPIVDTLITAMSITAIVLTVREACEDPEDVNGCSLGKGFATLVFGPPTLVYGFSAAIGGATVQGCNSAVAAHAALQTPPPPPR